MCTSSATDDPSRPGPYNDRCSQGRDIQPAPGKLDLLQKRKTIPYQIRDRNCKDDRSSQQSHHWHTKSLPVLGSSQCKYRRNANRNRRGKHKVAEPKRLSVVHEISKRAGRKEKVF